MVGVSIGVSRDTPIGRRGCISTRFRGLLIFTFSCILWGKDGVLCMVYDA